MYVMALMMGLDCAEIRRISYCALSWLIHRYSEITGARKGDDAPRKATDADIRALAMM